MENETNPPKCLRFFPLSVLTEKYCHPPHLVLPVAMCPGGRWVCPSCQ